MKSKCLSNTHLEGRKKKWKMKFAEGNDGCKRKEKAMTTMEEGREGGDDCGRREGRWQWMWKKGEKATTAVEEGTEWGDDYRRSCWSRWVATIK